MPYSRSSQTGFLDIPLLNNQLLTFNKLTTSMQTRFLKIISFLFFQGICTYCIGQNLNPFYNFKHLNVQNGLAQILYIISCRTAGVISGSAQETESHCLMGSVPLILSIVTTIRTRLPVILSHESWKIPVIRYG